MSALFLTGMMGSGKTTIGRALAKKLDLRFIDLDEEIERHTGKTIAELFELYGEAGFRKIESERLRNLPTEGAVVATGGGAVTSPANVAFMMKKGCIVCLNAPINVLEQRIAQSAVRPLYKDKSSLGRLLAARSSDYALCDISIDTDRSVSKTVGVLVDSLEPTSERPLMAGDNVYIAPDLLHENIPVQLLPKASKFAIVTHPRLQKHADAIARKIDGAIVFQVPPGEKSKSLRRLEMLLEDFASFGLKRDDAAIALGGGVIGDLTGFAAAVYMRGIDYIQMPTTLLAQVDAAIGGKTGVNLKLGKNLAGAFHMPTAVVCDPSLLEKLPRRHLVNGSAEIVKYGAILDPAIFLRCQQGPIWKPFEADWFDLRSNIVHRCARLKLSVVNEDPWERRGRRAILNFGHTIGHGLEQAMGFRGILHGEAVALGMMAESYIAWRMDIADESLLDRLSVALRRQGLPVRAKIPTTDEIMSALQRDKKNTADRVRMAMVQEAGKSVVLQDAPKDLIREAIEWIREEA